MSKSINLDQKLEYKGYWYLPSAPELKVAGIVTYYPNEQIILELIGAFDEGIETLFSNKKEPFIYGKTSDAKDISLIQCYQSSSLNFAAEFPIVRYTCYYMIVGKHIDSLDQKCQYFVQFRIPELSFWCYPAAIQSTIYSDKKEQGIKQVCLSFYTEYQSKNDIISSVDIDEETSIRLKRGITFDQTTYGLNPQLEQYTYVEIIKKEESSILEFLSYIHTYEDFISLATLSTVKSSDITLFDNELYEQYGEQKYYKPINIIHPYSDRENLTGNKKQDDLFNYSAIKDIYPDVLKAWFNASSDLYPIRSHLIDSLKNKKIYGSVDFLILIQAIEGFWWRFRDSKYRVNNNIPNRVKTSLKTIITELVSEYKNVGLLTKASIDIDAIVDSRHYYSHFLPKSKKPKVLDGIKLFGESKKIRVLLISCILSFVGFNNSQIDNIFKKSNFKFL